MNALAGPQRLDLDAGVLALLAACDLPVADLHGEGPAGLTLHGWRAPDGAAIGVVALQPLSGRAFLVRSLAVRPERRGEGLGGRLLARAGAAAAAAGGESLHLVTDSAEAFFRARGYHVRARTAAPPALRRTQLFRGLCPASAVYMTAPCRHPDDTDDTEDRTGP